MSSCGNFILGCAFCALAGVGIVGIFWRLRRPLDWAHRYDKQITEDGLYSALPIYRYLRHYLVVLLVAGVSILLMSVLLPVLVLATNNCVEPPTEQVHSLLLTLLAAQLTTATIYEIKGVKRRQRRSDLMQELVRKLGNRLWGSVIFLLLAIVALGGVSGFM